MPTTTQYQANGVTVEVAKDRVVARWEPTLHEKLNYADEDLLLRVLVGLEVRQNVRVNHLSQRELTLDPGDYRIELARAFQPEVTVQSPLEPTPSITWIQDSPNSQVLIWSHVNWDSVQNQVEQIHGLDWERDASVALKVIWAGQDSSTTEWFAVPARDHVTLTVPATKAELCVVERDTERVLKSLFVAHRVAVSPTQVLANVPVTVPLPERFLQLTREVVETNSLQFRADWRVTPASGDKVQFVLKRDGQVVQEFEVENHGEYYFHGLEQGLYQASLKKPKGKKPLILSRPLRLAHPGNSITLMPVDERKAFAYWSLEPDWFEQLVAQHGELAERLVCQLRVRTEFEGRFHDRPDLSHQVDLTSTRDFYLNFPPDRVYQVQLFALVDGSLEEALTPPSNSCQLGRVAAGTNPTVHKRVPQPLEHPSLRPLTGPTGISQYSAGFLILHLHAHLPFIPDPVHFGDGSEPWRPIGYPQEWYAEAVRETYLPLLGMFEELHSEGIDFRVSMDISPPVASMMKSQRHSADVLAYLERLIQLARLEVERTTREEPHYRVPAEMHLSHLRRSRDLFLGYGGDLVKGFRRFQELGKLELCTCIGTHPMLPLWTSQPQAIRGQALAAARFHEQTFGRKSLGVWLPECAYTPGIEPFLEEAGFRYAFGEEHAATRGDCQAEFGVNAPIYAKGSQIAIFARDPETGKQVWSGDEGYPGDPDYLEFHIRGGPFKYNRITDRRGGHKQPYVPRWATQRAADHAGHFMDCRRGRFEYLRRAMWKKPLVVAPYDAELFGHHWYEGPQFLYFLLKKLHFDQNHTELITPSAYLAKNPACQEMYANVSSWGHNGTFEKWMYGHISWMYRHGHEAAGEMGKMARSGAANELQNRLLCQAARQLMLAMSSDLPFVISNGHFVDRMKDLFFDALRGFWRLSSEFWQAQDGGDIDEEYLRCLELENCLFPDLDPNWFATLD